MKENGKDGVSVIMPVYKQEAFILRAIESLLSQTYKDWELIIVNDASPADLLPVIDPHLSDPRIRYWANEENKGLGYCLNKGIDNARFPFIAYLPSDDVYHSGHLAGLSDKLKSNEQAVLVYSGVRHHYNRYAENKIEGYPLQLVQVMHRKTSERWTERSELVTDDLERMYWSRLRKHGDFAGTDNVTCEWVDHPHQWHKIIREPEGGINCYRAFYGVKHPLRFQSSVGNYIDEVSKYRRFRERPDTPAAPNGLKILLVGDLGYVPERILALEERGNKLYGLWLQKPHWYTNVGPVPFGHITDIAYNDWRNEVKRIKPDIIYALLDWQSVPLAYEVLSANTGIPFVWNLKEGPFICLRNGMWQQLVELYRRSDGQIYPNPEMRAWLSAFIPGLEDQAGLVLDGDLPKKDWFKGERVRRLSEEDGEIHTVVPGRPIGLHPHVVASLAGQKIHLHVYGDIIHDQWQEWEKEVKRLAPAHFHVHPNIDQEHWTEELSKYDAGWLHYFESRNNGELRRMDWDDLNYPARFATYAFAGLPMIQCDNSGHIVAMQSLVKEMDIGIFIPDIGLLGEMLRDKPEMQRLSENIWRQRWYFTFDHHVDRLLDFFREVIRKQEAGARPRAAMGD